MVPNVAGSSPVIRPIIKKRPNGVFFHNVWAVRAKGAVKTNGTAYVDFYNCIILYVFVVLYDIIPNINKKRSIYLWQM